MSAQEIPAEWVERAAEAAWQADSLRAAGRFRLLPWEDAGEGVHPKWRSVAAAIIAAVAPLIAAREREACAAMIETHVYSNGSEGPYLRLTPEAKHDLHHRLIAAAIRARTD